MENIIEKNINVKDIGNLAKHMKWQYFERLACFVFEQNDFNVTCGLVIIFDRNKTKRQYDIIAKRFGLVFVVDCKKWKGGRYKASALKKAVEAHKERTKLYEEKSKENAIPLIVTLVQEDIIEHDGVFIVPLEKLNAFLNE